MYQKMA
jgi:hypothetical protein